MKILFVHNYLASFTHIDYELLSEQYAVRELYVRHGNPFLIIYSAASAIRDVFWCDLVFAWFGAYHALLPFLLAKMLNKRCVVVSSGYDVADEPALNYGNMRPGLRRWIGRLVFRLAHQVLAVSQFAAHEAIENTGVAKEKVQVIPHGIPLANLDSDVEALTRQPFIFTVSIISELTLTLKGLLDFAQLAALFPDHIFLIIGPHQDACAVQRLRKIAPSNLLLPGAMKYNDLRDFMHTASVYVQLSYYESFCMALAEAMLAGCVPVVVDRGALPEVVGDVGFVAPYGDLQQVGRFIEIALSSDTHARKLVSQRIATVFSLDARRRSLLKALGEIGR